MADKVQDSPFVKEAIDAACATVAKWKRDLLESDLLHRHSESPLESAWRVWWHVVTSGLHRQGPAPHVPHAVYQHVVEADGKRFRLDVAIMDWRSDGSRVPVLAVELDGHTFHERTPQQVADRNSRDRALQMAGWTVLHFSYDEIKSNGLQSAIEVLERFDALVMPAERTA
jgi:hypothetical protein